MFQIILPVFAHQVSTIHNHAIFLIYHSVPVRPQMRPYNPEGEDLKMKGSLLSFYLSVERNPSFLCQLHLFLIYIIYFKSGYIKDLKMVKPKLFDQIRDTIRVEYLSYRTEQEKSYVHWLKRYTLYHCKRHSDEIRTLTH